MPKNFVKAPKRVSLTAIGDDMNPNPWKGAYVIVRKASYAEVEQIDEMLAVARRSDDDEKSKATAERLLAFIKERLIEGKAPATGKDGKTELVAIEPDDIRYLGMDVVSRITDGIKGIVDPK